MIFALSRKKNDDHKNYETDSKQIWKYNIFNNQLKSKYISVYSVHILSAIIQNYSSFKIVMFCMLI